MMQGTVMKITEHCIVVLCEDGTFRNLPHQSVMPGLGEKISVPAAAEPRQRNRSRRYLNKYGIYAASFVLLLGVFFILQYLQGTKQNATLVAIDINPGIELVVNSRGFVDQATPMNEEARQLLSGEEVKNRDVYEALQRIFAKAEQQGYLDAKSGQSWVWLSVVDLGPGAYLIDPQKVGGADKGIHVEVFTADEQQWELAKQERLSLNKYIVKELAAEKGIQLSAEQLRSQSILRSLEQAGVDPEELFDGQGQPAAGGQERGSALAPGGSRHEPAKDGGASVYQQDDSLWKMGEQSSRSDQGEEGQDRIKQAAAGQHSQQTNGKETGNPDAAGTDASDRKESAGTAGGSSSGRVHDANGRPSDSAAQNQPGAGNAKPEGQTGDGQAEKPSKGDSHAEIRELKLEVKLAADGKLKLEYENKDGKVQAQVEKKTSEGEAKQQGSQAISFAENVIKHLDLNSKSGRQVVLSRVITALNIKQSEWLELKIAVDYSNGGKLEYEFDNPIKAQIEARENKQEQDKKAEQARKEREKEAEQAKEEQDKRNKQKQDNANEKANEKAKDKSNKAANNNANGQAKENGKPKEKEENKGAAQRPNKPNNKGNNDPDDDDED